MLNIVVIMGRLTAQPEIKTTPNGISVTSFSVAVDRNYQKNSTEHRPKIKIAKMTNAQGSEIKIYRRNIGKYFSIPISQIIDDEPEYIWIAEINGERLYTELKVSFIISLLVRNEYLTVDKYIFLKNQMNLEYNEKTTLHGFNFIRNKSIDRSLVNLGFQLDYE